MGEIEMAKFLAALVAVAALTSMDVVRADQAGSCGPGCHFAQNGGCVVDGWETGARVRNECPAGTRPRPPCGEGYVWRSREKACLLR
jgi:hypothetical protein